LGKSFFVRSAPGLVAEGSGAVDGVAEGVNDASEQLDADGNVDDGTGSLDNVAFLDQLVVTWQQNRAELEDSAV
jgi:hypothetical protein